MHVDVDRLMGRLSDLAEIGAIEGGGCARLALTDDDRAGRDLVVVVDARPRPRRRASTRSATSSARWPAASADRAR